MPIDPINLIGVSPLLVFVTYWLFKTFKTKSIDYELSGSECHAGKNSVNASIPSDAPSTDNSSNLHRTSAAISSEASASRSDHRTDRSTLLDGNESPAPVNAPTQQHGPQVDLQARRVCAKPPQGDSKTTAPAKDQVAEAAKQLISDRSIATAKLQNSIARAEQSAPEAKQSAKQSNEDQYRSVAKSSNHLTRDEVTTTISADTFALANSEATGSAKHSQERNSSQSSLGNNDKTAKSNSDKISKPDTHSISLANNSAQKPPGNNQASPEVANLAEVKLEKELARGAIQHQASKDRPQSKIELIMAKQFAEKSALKSQAQQQAQSQAKASIQTIGSQRENGSQRNGPESKSLSDQSDLHGANGHGANNPGTESTNDLATALVHTGKVSADKSAVNTLTTSAAGTSGVNATTTATATSQKTATHVASTTRTASCLRPTLLSKVRILDA